MGEDIGDGGAGGDSGDGGAGGDSGDGERQEMVVLEIQKMRVLGNLGVRELQRSE